MLTICWAAKGGSGTTVVAAALALTTHRPALLVDLDGELPAVLGIAEPALPGVADWLVSDAPPERLTDLCIEVRPGVSLLPWQASGSIADRNGGATTAPDRVGDGTRWDELASWLSARALDTEVTVDAGTGVPPAAVFGAAYRALIVTRPCYLGLRRAVRHGTRPTGAVLVDEPGRALRARDVEHALGCPIEATVSIDPAVARAVDAGLLGGRLPKVITRELRRAVAA